MTSSWPPTTTVNNAWVVKIGYPWISNLSKLHKVKLLCECFYIHKSFHGSNFRLIVFTFLNKRPGAHIQIITVCDDKHGECALFAVGWSKIKMPPYQYRKSHGGDKTVVRSGFPIQVRWHLYIESRPSLCANHCMSVMTTLVYLQQLVEVNNSNNNNK